MSTNNFYNHENGIYVLPMQSLQEFIEAYGDDEFFEDAEEQDFIEALQFQEEQDAEEFLDINMFLAEELAKVYDLQEDRDSLTVYNKQGKTVASLSLRSGYYEGVQLIVETDPGELGLDGYTLSESYTPHHKRLLKIVAQHTTAINLVGSFSNGEAVYELK